MCFLTALELGKGCSGDLAKHSVTMTTRVSEILHSLDLLPFSAVSLTTFLLKSKSLAVREHHSPTLHPVSNRPLRVVACLTCRAQLMTSNSHCSWGILGSRSSRWYRGLSKATPVNFA